MKRTGQRRRKNKSRSYNPEHESDRIKFQDKRIKDQQDEIDKQWQKIQKSLMFARFPWWSNGCYLTALGRGCGQIGHEM